MRVTRSNALFLKR